MKNLLIASACMGMLVMASCQEKKPEPPPGSADTASAVGGPSAVGSVSIEPGVAGGSYEGTITVTVTVTAVDQATRKVTLTGDDGTTAIFTAGPEIRNLDQIKAGDKLTATLTERMLVYVRSGMEAPDVTHAAALARAPKGAKPGALLAEEAEVTATVQAIDTDTRTATLLFLGGETRKVKVRSDVDLSKYKVGDTVVIRISESLALLVKKP